MANLESFVREKQLPKYTDAFARVVYIFVYPSEISLAEQSNEQNEAEMEHDGLIVVRPGSCLEYEQSTRVIIPLRVRK